LYSCNVLVWRTTGWSEIAPTVGEEEVKIVGVGTARVKNS